MPARLQKVALSPKICKYNQFFHSGYKSTPLRDWFGVGALFGGVPAQSSRREASTWTFFDRFEVFSNATDLKNALVVFVLRVRRSDESESRTTFLRLTWHRFWSSQRFCGMICDGKTVQPIKKSPSRSFSATTLCRHAARKAVPPQTDLEVKYFYNVDENPVFSSTV